MPAKVALHCLAPVGSDVGARRDEPVRCGIPWPQGALAEAACLELHDAQGRPRPLQARALARWPDGSVRWTLLDWLASVPAGGTAAYSVVAHSHPPTPAVSKLTSEPTGNGDLTIDTGRATFVLGPGDEFPFAAVLVNGRSVLDSRHSGLLVTDDQGRTFRPRIDRLLVEEGGPVRLVVKAEGCLSRRGSKPVLRLVARLRFFADSATVEVHLTLHNPRRAGHPSGRWALGSSGSVYLEDAALTLALADGALADGSLANGTPDGGSGGGMIHCSPELGMPLARCAGPLELYQDSSGGEHWQSSNHLTRELSVASRFRGYALRCGAEERTGLRATPVTTVESAVAHFAVGVRYFWQNFPKAIEATPDSLTLRLFPGRYDALHEIQGGEQKTHCFHLAFDRDRVTDLPLDWSREPLLARAEPQWYAASGAVPFLVPRADDPHIDYLTLVDSAIKGNDTFASKRERIDEYGWRNFGDLYADHETLFHQGEPPLISHYNNQYDAIAGFWIHFMRSGDPRWQELARELAQHVVDIDIYHTDQDKAAYNRGMFWHTSHYTDAHTATHRGAPRLPGVTGGGPSPGHLYTSGLVLQHYLTGDPTAREAVLSLGQYVIDSDDGRLSRFRWLSHAPTGYASESGFDGYHGPGRSPGNAIKALVDAHRLSGDRRFLDRAEALIRRCIHPADDLEERQLLDAENRWFYNVFLVSLGEYVDYKKALEEPDRMWRYARAALLHYARWALPREYPYLERPEILEFPTETWAAQDMRKSVVFNLAARHASGAERGRFLERASYFFDQSVGQLSAMETRTFCRPLVLMLTLGHGQAWFARESLPVDRQATEEPDDFGLPVAFVPQKAIVKKRLLILAVVATSTAAWILLFL